MSAGKAKVDLYRDVNQTLLPQTSQPGLVVLAASPFVFSERATGKNKKTTTVVLFKASVPRDETKAEEKL